MANKNAAEAYAEQGYDVNMRGDSMVLDVPNPRVNDDDYFHGANPNKVGYSSHGLAAEGGGLDLNVEPGDERTGQSTADVQNRNDASAGWNQQAGSVAGDQGGEPDESWTNARIQSYADQQGIDTAGAKTKAELLDAVRAGRTSE